MPESKTYVIPNFDHPIQEALFFYFSAFLSLLCKLYNTLFFIGDEMADWWEGRKVRIPVPTRKIIEQMYGANWRYPFPDFRWNLDPFLTGYCRY